MRFIITTHHTMRGARLSRPGHFGNLPFDCEADAIAYGNKVAKGAACHFQYENRRAPRVVHDA